MKSVEEEKMNKKFYLGMFCAFTCLALLGFFILQPVVFCFNIFMACVYLAKFINM